MAPENKYFSESQIALVESILDRIIPANHKMPDASEIALGFVDSAVGGSSALSRLFGAGIAEIDIKAHATHSKEFTQLADDQKDEILRAIEVESPDFFGELVRQTYNGYYTNPLVLELLGLETHAPQPRGRRLEEGKFSLTGNVIKRGAVFRRV